MKRLFNFTLCLLFLCSLIVSADAQKRRGTHPHKAPAAPQADEPPVREGEIIQTTICKGMPMPDGFVAAGETSTSDCEKGAWILKRRGTTLDAEVLVSNKAARSKTSSTDDGDSEDDEVRVHGRETSIRVTIGQQQPEEPPMSILEQRAIEAQMAAKLTLAVIKHKIMVGMTTAQVLESWGRPNRIDRYTSSYSGSSETWWYELSKGTAWIDIKDEKVSAFHANW